MGVSNSLSQKKPINMEESRDALLVMLNLYKHRPDLRHAYDAVALAIHMHITNKGYLCLGCGGGTGISDDADAGQCPEGWQGRDNAYTFQYACTLPPHGGVMGEMGVNMEVVDGVLGVRVSNYQGLLCQLELSPALYVKSADIADFSGDQGNVFSNLSGLLELIDVKLLTSTLRAAGVSTSALLCGEDAEGKWSAPERGLPNVPEGDSGGQPMSPPDHTGAIRHDAPRLGGGFHARIGDYGGGLGGGFHGDLNPRSRGGMLAGPRGPVYGNAPAPDHLPPPRSRPPRRHLHHGA